MLETGIKGRQEVVVSDANSAKTMGSGTLDVFATPAMTALMEKTAWMSVADQLDEGCGTVGTLLNVTHDAPTPLGMTVWCETELVEVDGRRLVFDVAAYDAKGKIGGGRHERFIIHDDAVYHMPYGKKEIDNMTDEQKKNRRRPPRALHYPERKVSGESE